VTVETGLIRKVYFLLICVVVIGFIVGVMFQLNKRGATPTELIDKLPNFLAKLFTHPPPPKNNKPKSNKRKEIEKLVAQRASKIADLNFQIRQVLKEKNRKKKENLCSKIIESIKEIKNIEKLISLQDKEVFANLSKEYTIELKSMLNLIRKEEFLRKKAICRFPISKGKKPSSSKQDGKDIPSQKVRSAGAGLPPTQSSEDITIKRK
jgi:uncharacterized membrane protein YraQ (UPF0718 family)